MKEKKDRKRHFDETEDILACYTMISVYSRIHQIKILEICFMVDHIHILLIAENPEAMAGFMRDFSSAYVLSLNASTGRSGQLLHKSYGNAPKRGDKKTRSTIIYIGNNPVEKKLCTRAEGYRWNFLPYILTPFPYSGKRTLRDMENSIRKLCKEVQDCRNRNEYLTHDKEFLTDFIVMRYWCMDESAMISYFMDLKSMIEAMASTTGSEHDICETFIPEPDTSYHEMTAIIQKVLPGTPVRKIISFSIERKMKVASFLRQTTSASFSQICRFLHIDRKRSTT